MKKINILFIFLFLSCDQQARCEKKITEHILSFADDKGWSFLINMENAAIDITGGINDLYYAKLIPDGEYGYGPVSFTIVCGKDIKIVNKDLELKGACVDQDMTKLYKFVEDFNESNIGFRGLNIYNIENRERDIVVKLNNGGVNGGYRTAYALQIKCNGEDFEVVDYNKNF